MRRLPSAVLAAALVLTLAGTTLVAKGGHAGTNGGGGSNTATIALVQPLAASTTSAWPSAGSTVSFTVTANVKASSVPYLWVANWCYQDGVAVYAEFQGVQSWSAGPFTLSWNGGAAQCTAYVFLFPNTNTPLPGGTMSYSVSG